MRLYNHHHSFNSQLNFSKSDYSFSIMAAPKITFYLDIGSPFSCIAFHVLRASSIRNDLFLTRLTYKHSALLFSLPVRLNTFPFFSEIWCKPAKIHLPLLWRVCCISLPCLIFQGLHFLGRINQNRQVPMDQSRTDLLGSSFRGAHVWSYPKGFPCTYYWSPTRSMHHSIPYAGKACACHG